MRALLLLALLLPSACSKRQIDEASLEHSDDYVLIEFASKLEEDYHKIDQIPLGHESEKKKSR